MEWGTVCELIRKGHLEKLVRSDKVLQKYREHKEKCEVNAYVLNNLQWSWEDIQQANDDKRELLSDTSLYKITKNDFPYDFEAGIYHLIIWSKVFIPLYNNKNEKDIDLEAKIDKFFHEKMEKFKVKADNYIWFMNTTGLQSVRSISHLHLLLRCDQGTADEILKKF